MKKINQQKHFSLNAQLNGGKRGIQCYNSTVKFNMLWKPASLNS